MLLENMTSTEVADYLREKNSLLIPVGAVEQHGPYGIIGTDFITAQSVAREVGKRLELLVAPTPQKAVIQQNNSSGR